MSTFTVLSHNIVLTGDFNLPKLNWGTYNSTDDYENDILSLVINNMKQIIDYKTTSTSVYDHILTNSDADIIHAERDLNFTENFSNHYDVVFELAFCTQVSKKQLVFYSYCQCDFDSLNESIALDPFNPICNSNPDVHVEAWYDWFFDLISQRTPRRTIKRQNTQRCITHPRCTLLTNYRHTEIQ